MYGREFTFAAWDDYEAKRAALDDEALWRGYCVRHYRRPYAFISLALPPRTRVEARRILAERGESEAIRFAISLCRDHGHYFAAVVSADYMAPTRRAWIDYIRTARTEGYGPAAS